MPMNLKKFAGLIGIIACVLLLVLVGFTVISWRLFWMGTILVAGYAYFIVPKIKE